MIEQENRQQGKEKKVHSK